MNNLNQQFMGVPSQGVCPSCGYCPSCGRSNQLAHVYPYIYWGTPQYYNQPQTIPLTNTLTGIGTNMLQSSLVS